VEFFTDYKTNEIYWSLNRIKFLGTKAAAYIVTVRARVRFTSIEDFIERVFRHKLRSKDLKHWDEVNPMVENGRVPVNTRHLKNMILAGCFDKIELAPTVQLEAGANAAEGDEVTKKFFELYEAKKGIITDVILSEEGGRFLNEENKNVIIEIDASAFPTLPSGYFWLTYSTLNNMIQYNNVLNIQLRNLLSLLNL
jgi:oxidase EvaA